MRRALLAVSVAESLLCLRAEDPKSQLQEFLQSQSKPLPVYELLRIEGKAPLETFYVRCSSGQNQIETRGKSRKIAEQIAAQSLLERIKGVSV